MAQPGQAPLAAATWGGRALSSVPRASGYSHRPQIKPLHVTLRPPLHSLPARASTQAAISSVVPWLGEEQAWSFLVPISPAGMQATWRGLGGAGWGLVTGSTRVWAPGMLSCHRPLSGSTTEPSCPQVPCTCTPHTIPREPRVLVDITRPPLCGADLHLT